MLPVAALPLSTIPADTVRPAFPVPVDRLGAAVRIVRNDLSASAVFEACPLSVAAPVHGPQTRELPDYVNCYERLPESERDTVLHSFMQLDLAEKKSQWEQFAIGGNLRIAQFCIDSGIEAEVVNMRDELDQTALTQAIRNDDRDLVEVLLSTPAIDVNTINGDGETALFYAVSENNPWMLERLLACPDIDLNSADDFGNTPLILAACLSDPTMVNLLLAFPEIDINAQSSDGATALIEAARQGCHDVVQALLDAPHVNVDVNLVDAQGDSALSNAIWHNHPEIIRLLRKHPDINPNVGRPLHKAAFDGDVYLLDYLLTIHGMDVNARDKHGNTALMEAVRATLPATERAGYTNASSDFDMYSMVIEALLDQPSIDVTLTNRHGETAAQCALRSLYPVLSKRIHSSVIPFA